MAVSFNTGISLRTQLYSLVIGISLITFMGTFWVGIDNTRDYLNKQMTSHAQDAATSVGLSISPYMDGENDVIVETMIMAIFDSGYYQKVTLQDIDGNTIISRTNPLAIDGVPPWFIKLFELSSPVMSSEVNNGWNIAGVLSFQSHSGSSYITLWQHAVNNFYSSLLIALCALILAYLILRAVLKPLSAVEEQAISVSKKHFTLIKKLPLTRELKTVIHAMNSMVSNIEASFNLVSKQADKLTTELFIDELTQLGNRRAFQSQFTIMLNEMQPTDLATLGLVQLHSLQAVNTKIGYKAGDNYVCQAATLLTTKLNAFSGVKLYRVSGGSFFFSINSTGEEVSALCQHINTAFTSLHSGYYEHGFGKLVATTYNSRSGQSALLSKLDTLLTQENSATASGEIYTEKNTDTAYGLHQWSQLIDDLVSSNHIEFTFQPIISALTTCHHNTLNSDDEASADMNSADMTSADNTNALESPLVPETESYSAKQALVPIHKVLYFELFTQFYKNVESIPNNQLFAMAERTYKSQELDKLILTQLTQINNFTPDSKIAINLTHQSLHSADFSQWLSQFIMQNKANLPSLIFEINEDAILAGIESSMHFIQLVKSLGIEVCIDRFGASFTSFKYLKGLDVDYLKIDGAYIHELDLQTENKHFIQAVTQIAHGVGIKILASHVETTAVQQLLLSFDCDGLQGNGIQKTLKLMEINATTGCIYSPIKVS